MGFVTRHLAREREKERKIKRAGVWPALQGDGRSYRLSLSVRPLSYGRKPLHELLSRFLSVIVHLVVVGGLRITAVPRLAE